MLRAPLLFILGLTVSLSSICATQNLPEAPADGLTSQELLGSSSCRPEKIRLALTDEYGELRIAWNTKHSGCTNKVHFGLALTTPVESGDELPAHLNSVASFLDLDSYKAKDFCGKPATRDDFSPPNLHSAIFTDLEEGQWYEYRIGHHGPTRRFKAPPSIGPHAEFSFIAYGDMGEPKHKAAKSPGAGLTSGQVLKQVLDGNADLVVHVGDIAYADGNQDIWNTFLDEIEPYASRVPYQIAIGNHEYDWETEQEKKHRSSQTDASGNKEPYDPEWGNFGNDSGGECGVTVSRLFPMSGRHQGSDDLPAENSHHSASPPFWYSYDYGSAHFATLSSEHDLTGGSKQIRWLRRDLEAVDRCQTPWLILLIHRPMYVVHPHKSNRIVGDHLRESLEDILEEFEVDIVISGHVHAYARTCNVFKEQCIDNDEGGTTHITLGCGGRKLSEVQHMQPIWLEHAERNYGFGRVHVKRRHLRFDYIHSETGKVADSVELSIGRSASRYCEAVAMDGSSGAKVWTPSPAAAQMGGDYPIGQERMADEASTPSQVGLAGTRPVQPEGADDFQPQNSPPVAVA